MGKRGKDGDGTYGCAADDARGKRRFFSPTHPTPPYSGSQRKMRYNPSILSVPPMRRALPLLCLLLLTTPATAATFQSSDAFTLASPVNDDLYAAGKNVSITKDVNGDLFVAGGKVDIENRVSQSLFIAGGTVRVMSSVGDDLRVAGGDVLIRGTIRGDLVVFGGTVTVGSDAVVLGDVVVSGGDITLRGPVGRNLIARGGNLSLEGIFHGDVDARGGTVVVHAPVEGDARLAAGKIQILNGTSFKGGVEYWSRSPVDFGASLSQNQSAVFQPNLHEEETGPTRPLAGVFTAFLFLSLLSGILVIAVLTLATKTFFTDTAKLLRRRPWWSFLWGILFFIVTPILVLILFLTAIGFPFALLLLAAYLLTLLFTPAITAIVVTRWVEQTWKKQWNTLQIIGISAAAFVLFKLLFLLPLIGWSINAVLVCFAIGALLLTKTARWKKIR